MAGILLVGRTPFLDEHIRFLLGLAGFELTQVRTIEEAINLIEINESFSPVFGLLLIPVATLVHKDRKYIGLIDRLADRIQIMLIGREGEFDRYRPALGGLFESQRVVIARPENVLGEIKRFFGSEESAEIPTSSSGGGEHEA